jgi:hypothetical protein
VATIRHDRCFLYERGRGSSGDIRRNLIQEAPQAFTQAVIDVDKLRPIVGQGRLSDTFD